MLLESGKSEQDFFIVQFEKVHSSALWLKMLRCYVCKLHHTSCSVFFRHLKFQHILYLGKLPRSGYAEHDHGSCHQVVCLSIAPTLVTSGTYPKHMETTLIQTASVSQPDDIDPPSTVTTHFPVKKGKYKAVLLQSSGVPECTVQYLVGLLEKLVNDIHAHAKLVCQLMHQEKP